MRTAPSIYDSFNAVHVKMKLCENGFFVEFCGNGYSSFDLAFDFGHLGQSRAERFTVERRFDENTSMMRSDLGFFLAVFGSFNREIPILLPFLEQSQRRPKVLLRLLFGSPGHPEPAFGQLDPATVLFVDHSLEIIAPFDDFAGRDFLDRLLVHHIARRRFDRPFRSFRIELLPNGPVECRDVFARNIRRRLGLATTPGSAIVSACSRIGLPPECPGINLEGPEQPDFRFRPVANKLRIVTIEIDMGFATTATRTKPVFIAFADTFRDRHAIAAFRTGCPDPGETGRRLHGKFPEHIRPGRTADAGTPCDLPQGFLMEEGTTGRRFDGRTGRRSRVAIIQ